MHYPIMKDALEAGKHVFCEKSLVFTPAEVHGLRQLHEARPNQVIQVGLQRRYSEFYHAAKKLIDDGPYAAREAHKVGLIDMAHVFKNYKKFEALRVAEADLKHLNHAGREVLGGWIYDAIIAAYVEHRSPARRGDP